MGLLPEKSRIYYLFLAGTPSLVGFFLEPLRISVDKLQPLFEILFSELLKFFQVYFRSLHFKYILNKASILSFLQNNVQWTVEQGFNHSPLKKISSKTIKTFIYFIIYILLYRGCKIWMLPVQNAVAIPRRWGKRYTTARSATGSSQWIARKRRF